MVAKLILSLICACAFALPVLAQDGPPPMPELDGEIVMAGLTGPQGLYVDTDGNLWVIDSGMGGDEAVTFFNTETFEPVEGRLGLTSHILRLTPDHTVEEIASLPSISISITVRPSH